MKRRSFLLTSRDQELLADIYKHRFLTIQQLRRLHFPSKQTTYRRIRLLAQHKYTDACKVANVNEAVITLGPSGVTIVADMLGVAKADLKWVGSTSRPRDYYFLRHFLAINDFRIHLKLACAASDITLLGFIPDYYGERTPTGGTAKYIRDVICDINREQKTVSHTPDGVFALQKGESTALFFLEIDRGTEVVGDEEKGVLKSLRFYSNYLLTNGYQRYEADFGVTAFKGFRSLYVTSSKTRLANIRRSAAQLTVAQKVRRFHWIVASEELTEKSLLTPIWLSCDHEDTTKYQIG